MLGINMLPSTLTPSMIKYAKKYFITTILDPLESKIINQSTDKVILYVFKIFPEYLVNIQPIIQKIKNKDLIFKTTDQNRLLNILIKLKLIDKNYNIINNKFKKKINYNFYKNYIYNVTNKNIKSNITETFEYSKTTPASSMDTKTILLILIFLAAAYYFYTNSKKNKSI